MRTPRRTPEANVLRDLERQLDELRAEVRSARAESAASFAQVDRMARVIRVSRRTLTEAEMQAGWDRLAPDLSLIRWKPRSGEPDRPELGSGLIDRLKSGDPVSDTLGNTAPFVGAANAIVDPLLEVLGNPDRTISSPGTDTEIGREWLASYTVHSGAFTQIQWDDLYPRGMPTDNPFNSEIVGLYHYGSTSAHDVTSYLWQRAELGSYQTRLPYIVAAVQVSRLGAVDAAYTSAVATVEIVRTDTSTVVASASIDLTTVTDDAPRQLACHALVAAPTAYYIWRFTFRTVKNASGSSVQAYVFIGEPQLHFSFTTDPLPFQPQLASWTPASVVAYTGAGDQVAARFDSSGAAWGDGVNGADVELERTRVGELTLRGGTDETRLVISGYSLADSLIEMRSTGSNVYSAVLFTEGVSVPGAIRAGIDYGTGTSQDITIFTATGSAGSETFTERMRIKSDGTVTIGVDGGGTTADGVQIGGDTNPGSIELRSANPFIDFKADSSDYGFRIIYDFNVSDGVEFAGATGGYYFKDGPFSTDTNPVRGGGSSFPGSPATNDRYFRTDLGMEFYYDGTRWVSMNLYRQDFVGPVAAISATSSNLQMVGMPGNGTVGVLVVKSIVNFIVASGGSALGASHKWVGTIQRDTGGLLATINIDSGSSNVWRSDVQTLNSVYGGGLFSHAVSWTKTGTPGNLTALTSIEYRLVAT